MFIWSLFCSSPGQDCEQEIPNCRDDPCQNSGTCSPSDEGYLCNCLIVSLSDNLLLSHDSCKSFWKFILYPSLSLSLSLYLPSFYHDYNDTMDYVINNLFSLMPFPSGFHRSPLRNQAHILWHPSLPERRHLRGIWARLWRLHLHLPFRRQRWQLWDRLQRVWLLALHQWRHLPGRVRPVPLRLPGNMERSQLPVVWLNVCGRHWNEPSDPNCTSRDNSSGRAYHHRVT